MRKKNIRKINAKTIITRKAADSLELKFKALQLRTHGTVHSDTTLHGKWKKKEKREQSEPYTLLVYAYM